MSCMNSDSGTKLKTKTKPRPIVAARRKAVIHKLQPLNGEESASGEIEQIQVFRFSNDYYVGWNEDGQPYDDGFDPEVGFDNEEPDMAISFQTSEGTLTWFTDRKSLRELGRRLVKL